MITLLFREKKPATTLEHIEAYRQSLNRKVSLLLLSKNIKNSLTLGLVDLLRNFFVLKFFYESFYRKEYRSFDWNRIHIILAGSKSGSVTELWAGSFKEK